MTALYPPDVQVLAHEVFALLQAMDPSRFREELRESARQRIEQLSARFDQAVEQLQGGGEVDRAPSAMERVAAVLDEAPEPGGEWEAFRKRLHKAYDELVVELRREAIELPTLRPTNYARSGFHVFSAVGAALLVQHALSPRGMVLVAGGFAVSGWIMETSRRVSPAANRALMWVFKNVAHEHEKHRLNSSTWYTTALLILSLTMDARAITAALLVLGLGDPTAGLVGRRFGRTKLRSGRSLEGSLAFVAAGALAAFAGMRIYYPSLGLGPAAALSLAAGAAGALAELFITRVDDNFSIPLAAGAGCTLAAALLGV